MKIIRWGFDLLSLWFDFDVHPVVMFRSFGMPNVWYAQDEDEVSAVFVKCCVEIVLKERCIFIYDREEPITRS